MVLILFIITKFDFYEEIIHLDCLVVCGCRSVGVDDPFVRNTVFALHLVAASPISVVLGCVAVCRGSAAQRITAHRTQSCLSQHSQCTC